MPPKKETKPAKAPAKKDGGGKAKKKKWSKGKVRDKLNNLVLFDKGRHWINGSTMSSGVLPGQISLLF